MSPIDALRKPLAALLTSLALFAHASASAAPVYGEQLEGFHYPFPLQHFDFQSQQQPLSMGYMDVKPAQRANGTTVARPGKRLFAP